VKRFILTPRAKQDLYDIWDHIAADNIEAADRVLESLHDAMVKLARAPGIGHWREELTDKRHRLFLVYSYPIVYRHETTPMQIIRILHASRDVESILGLYHGQRATLAEAGYRNGKPVHLPLPSQKLGIMNLVGASVTIRLSNASMVRIQPFPAGRGPSSRGRFERPTPHRTGA
jgi:toxin ParE1/3/4